MHAFRSIVAAGRWRAALLVLCALALSVFMTWPLAPQMGSVARTGIAGNADPRFPTNGDGLFSLWNVSWVARTIVADPANLFDANIFYPHKNSLAYSEANLVAGAVGAPAWWLTKNPYATLNFVILLGFASAWLFTWRLVHYLTGDGAAAAVAGILFAFCPYVFAHTAHIQLMLTGGIPLAMLMLHRVADAPSIWRGIALGAALVLQALACAYYGIFAGLMVGFAVLFLSISRSLFRSAAWWKAVGTAAAVAIGGVLPFLLPFIAIQEEEGFGRSLHESIAFSANAASYLASSATAHRWLLERISSWPRWNEVMFPGFLTLALAALGLVAVIAGRRQLASRQLETTALYGSLGLLAFWASWGPNGGLYTLLYKTIPVFSFLRAPSRMAIVVVLCLAVVGAFATRWLLNALPKWRPAAGAALIALAIGELWTVMPWERAVTRPSTYDVLAKMPPGPLAEFPFYGGREAWHLHTQYMLFSASHWMPMMNGYSDHTPPSFREDAFVLDSFPSDDSFAVLERARIRYIHMHWERFGPRANEMRDRLRPYRVHLRPLASSGGVSLYEIISFP